MGNSMVNGHPDSWLDGIRFHNVRLFVSHDVQAPYESTATALTIRQARNFELSNLAITWEKPPAQSWQNALLIEQVSNLLLDRLTVSRPPSITSPAIVLKKVDGVTVSGVPKSNIHQQK
jgi:hypothetical protein